MPYTTTFSVDAAGNPEPIIAQSECRVIEVYENAQIGNTDYRIRRAPSTTFVTRPAGARTRFEAHPPGTVFYKDQVVGEIEAVTAGSYTFAQEET